MSCFRYIPHMCDAPLFGRCRGCMQIEYLERIFFDAILHHDITSNETDVPAAGKYEKIGNYLVQDYKEQPHEYQDHEKSRK